MPWTNLTTLRNDIARLTASMDRVEARVDAAIQQAATDRSITQAHIAECNLRNKRADEEEVNAKREWEDFKKGVFGEISNLSSKVGSTQYKLGLVIATATGVLWAADHFHLFAIH